MLLALWLFLFSSAQSAGTVTSREDDTAVRATIAALVEAGLRRDADAIGALYEEDFVHTNPDGSIWNRAKVLETYRAKPAAEIESSEHIEDLVRVRGDTALVVSRARIRSRQGTAPPVVRPYRVTYILRRSGPRWVIAASHASLILDGSEDAMPWGPPREAGAFRSPDLLELKSLDPTIRLDIRYATANNFLGEPVYRQARAFLQRPAAQALGRANTNLRKRGYGLLVFDGYRPWTVTKRFWDRTPPDKKQFVADPATGSRHNRGCAVDLSLFDLRTGKEVQMPGAYDEMSERSHVAYSGGAPESRRLRDLLRSAMENEGFAVYEHEWWHFDYKDWKEYPILDIPFEALADATKSSS